MSSRQDRPWVLALALLVAILLTLMPLPPWLQPFRPYWLGLVIIYWSLEVNQPLSLGVSFTFGLFVDLLMGSLLGLHALSLVIIVYLVRRFRARMRFFPAWQQALAVLALLINDRIVLLWVAMLMNEQIPTWHYWLAPLVGMALWPWLFLLLDLLRMQSRSSGAAK